MALRITYPIMVLFAAALVGFSLLAIQYDFSGALPALFLIVIIAYLSKGTLREEFPKFYLDVFYLAILAKLVSTGARFAVGYNIYGFQDTGRYDASAGKIALEIWSGNFDFLDLFFDGGTDAMGAFLGIIYALTGETLLGGFMVFSALAFAGSIMFIKAFSIAFPNGDIRFFSILVLFAPSVLYWPAGIGKDALTFFAAGLFALGVALALVQGRWKGLALLTIAIGLTSIVRFETALVMVVALVPALLRRSATTRVSPPSITLLLGCAVAFVIVLSAGEHLTSISLLSPSDAIQILEAQAQAEYDETGAGSNFEVLLPTDPLWVPSAFITVLFRPFPWEVDSLQALVQAFEGPLLAILVLFRSQGIGRAFRAGLREPYVLFVLTFALVLILGLSTLGNFGLLARQRAIVFPLLFMLLAYAPVVTSRFDRQPQRS